jgi:16S rRNA (cytosine1402-N4)-methyltransferase
MDGDHHPGHREIKMTDLTSIHTPVLLERCVELLAPALDREGAIAMEATDRMGGHSHAVLQRFPNKTVIGFERDTDALAIATERLKRFGTRLIPVHAVYDNISAVLAEHNISRVDGILFDLGVSSLQLDEADRGFAYSKAAPLDMRMNAEDDLTAADVLASYDEHDLARIFHEYGDEKLGRRFAKAIVKARAVEPIETSTQLVSILTDATPCLLYTSPSPRDES